MDLLTWSPLLAVALFVLLGAGVWVAISLLGVAYLTMIMFSSAPMDSAMGTSIWASLSTWTLTALPLFIWMGEILFRTRLSSDLFEGLAPWVGKLPGRLVHVNVFASGIFAAVSGSSAATAATVGQMSLPELKKRGYADGISVGSLAASGTLGLLIPPSIILIVYGVSVNVSIGRLFLAGVFPGILLMLLFISYIAIWSVFNRDKMPASDLAFNLREAVLGLRLLLPTVLLIVAVIGSIYAGFATATEAASLGVAGALVIAKLSGSLSWGAFKESLFGATKTSCMIAFILAGAAFLTTAMGYSGIPRALAMWIDSMGLSANQLLVALAIMYLILGCFLDGISMIVLSAAVVIPMVTQLDINLIWFGIFLTILVEAAQITPPVGFNLFVVQGITKHGLWFIAKSTFPFFAMMILALAILTYFPELATWLPGRMRS